MRNAACVVPEKFKAWVLSLAEGVIRGGFAQFDETELDEGDVLVRVEYASVSARDVRNSHGNRTSHRRLPCIGGSDLAGEVIESATPRFRPGDKVIATGYGLGIKHHGAYSERALIPGGWVLPLPGGLTPAECMVLGTPGLAVAMAISRLEETGLKPERGPVLVSGAGSDCGALALVLLAARGYEVVALAESEEMGPWLMGLGVSDVLICDKHTRGAIRQKERALWAAAIDNSGSETLSWILGTAKPGSSVVALASQNGEEYRVPALPFLERGVSLLGVDAIQAGFASREKAWARLCGDLLTPSLARLHRVVAFEELPGVFEQLLGGQTCGRTIVRIAAKGSEKEGI